MGAEFVSHRLKQHFVQSGVMHQILSPIHLSKMGKQKGQDTNFNILCQVSPFFALFGKHPE